MSEVKGVKGYKVFCHDWTCSPNGNTKQYTCPGVFEENVDLSVCNKGMHFCKKAVDCFHYYSFSSKNKVAEVIAYGTVIEKDDKYCTDKLKIISEIPWAELLEIVNIGKGCTGFCNSGDFNSGDYNSGDFNSGDYNSGDFNSGDSNDGDSNSGDCNDGNSNSGDFNSGNSNSGDFNSGDFNSGNFNSGYGNSGNYNSGDFNSGNSNSGHHNSGNRNSGNYNSGNYNSGDHNGGNHNSGSYNSGNHNSGNHNVGNFNSGNHNIGDWNKCDFSNGCFNTISLELKIPLFNKLSEWTNKDWLCSEALYLMNEMPSDGLEYIEFENMTDEEKAEHPEAETTGGYLKKIDNSSLRIERGNKFSDNGKNIIMSIPNFDKDVFREITGIDVDENKLKKEKN